MKSCFAIAALLGVSVFAANDVAIDGPTLNVNGSPFAKMTLTTGWMKDRNTAIDGEENLNMMVTSRVELQDGAVFKEEDEIQFWHCGSYMHGDDKNYCTAYHHKVGSSTYWDTSER